MQKITIFVSNTYETKIERPFIYGTSTCFRELLGETYLFVTNMYGSYGDYHGYSVVYKWDGTSFIEHQRIPTTGAEHAHTFTINNDSYLIVANVCDGITDQINSIVYKWNGDSFVEFQAIPTKGGTFPKTYLVDGNTYLAIGNLYNEPNNLILYKFNGISFVMLQSLDTGTIMGMDSFLAEGQMYLAVAVQSNSERTTVNTNSQIYKWNGTSLVTEQEIPTNSAYDVHIFVMGGEQYLAIPNSGNDQTRNIDSKIYKWIPENTPPTADAGINLSIQSDQVSATTIHGTATDPDGDPLEYRWLEGAITLIDWQSVGSNGEANLDLGAVPFFSIGEHTLTLEVRDANNTSTDSMALTVTYDNWSNTEGGCVTLLDHNGNGLPGGKVKYACGGSWQPEVPGTTNADGKLCFEVTCTNLSKVVVTYNQGSVQQTPSELSALNATWQTVEATVALIDSDGFGIAGGKVDQGGGYWFHHGYTNEDGKFKLEMFGGKSYKFRMTYNFGSNEITQDVATPFVFQTGAVYSDSGTATKYARGSWQDFSQNIELLSGNWQFKFNDGTPITYYTITSGTTKHIH